MRILVVCQYFAPEPFRVSALCESLQALGHEVTVLTGMPNYPEGKLYQGYGLTGPWHELGRTGIEIFRAPLVPRGKGGKASLALNYISFALSASLRSLFLLRRPFDLIFVYQLSPITMALPAILLSKLKRIPLVLYSLDLWPDTVAATGVHLPLPMNRLLVRVCSHIYNQPQRLLVSSRGFICRMLALGVSTERLYYWPQSIRSEIPTVTNDKIYSIRDKIPSGFILMFTGNIGASQGFPTILAAAEKLKVLKDLHWVILGEGRLRTWVEDQVRVRGLHNNFHLLGRYPSQDMPFWYNMADALLVSLKKDPAFSLTLPAKVQSYLAAGKPIVAAMDGEGARVVQEAQAGLVCGSDDPDGLAAIITKMMALPNRELAQFGINGMEYVHNHFNQDQLMKEMDEILTTLVNSKTT